MKLGREIIDDVLIEILTTEERIAVSRLHFEHAVANLQHGHIEGAAAQIIDRDHAHAFFLQPVRESSSGRLVDDPQHFEASDLAGVFRCLALGIVEIGRHRDDGLADGLAEIAFCVLFHLLQDEGADLARRIFGSPAFDPGVAVLAFDDAIGNEFHIPLRLFVLKAASNEALDGEECALRIGDRLAFRRMSDEAFIRFSECNHRRRRPEAFRTFDDLRLRPFHYGDARIRRTQVDTDYFAHLLNLFLSYRSARSAGPTCGPGS